MAVHSALAQARPALGQPAKQSSARVGAAMLAAHNLTRFQDVLLKCSTLTHEGGSTGAGLLTIVLWRRGAGTARGARKPALAAIGSSHSGGGAACMSDIAQFGGQNYLSLETFKRNGQV